ncbi:MAG: RidA family protein [Chloroflexi bacterium]|nr:RidA family protein [Chloroflexota bacterium]
MREKWLGFPLPPAYSEASFLFLSATGRDPGTRQWPVEPERQGEIAIDKIRSRLEASGVPLDNVVRTSFYYRNREVMASMGEVRRRALGVEKRPASASLMLFRFDDHEQLLEIEATALLPRGWSFQKQVVEFDPPRVYCDAVVVGPYVFLSGAGGVGSTPQEQARDALRNIQPRLEKKGTSLDNAFLISFYVPGEEHISHVRQVCHEFRLPQRLPIVTSVVSGYARDEMKVEVEVSALVPR